MHEVAFLLIGTILGVAADRLWHRYENRQRIEVTGGMFANVEGEQGLNLSVVNLGSQLIPSFRIAIYRPAEGSFYAWRPAASGNLLPGERADFEFPLIAKDGPPYFLQHGMFSSMILKPAACSMRLTLERNPKFTIYENAPIGRNLVAISQVAKDTKSMDARGEFVGRSVWDLRAAPESPRQWLMQQIAPFFKHLIRRSPTNKP